MSLTAIKKISLQLLVVLLAVVFFPALDEMEKLYELLRTCSVKQLENRPLTEEENRSLKYIGVTVEQIDNTLANQP